VSLHFIDEKTEAQRERDLSKDTISKLCSDLTELGRYSYHLSHSTGPSPLN
jgi:hypothetical protein